MDAHRYKGKYRIPSTRLKEWDYGANVAYFVTICVLDRVHVFGEIEAGEMNLTDLGRVTQECWMAIPDHFPFVIPDEFVVMPNHVHGIVVINKSDEDESPDFARANNFGPQSQNLASIVRGFNIGVTKYARAEQMPFTWQWRYHDHVIRTDDEHERVRRYIAENVPRWPSDRYF